MGSVEATRRLHAQLDAPTIEARGLAHRYGRRSPRGGFAGLDLRLDGGTTVGVLGPNGAGKSTLLEVVATRLPPSAGTLRMFGTSVTRPTPSLRRRIGYASDEPVHIPHLTGAENALVFARAAGLTTDRARVATTALLEQFALAGDASRPVREYSYGMRRKLLLVEALAHEPELLVLDEPTLGLDAAARDALERALARTKARGAAVLLATNDLAAAQTLSDRVLLLHEGRQVVEGSPAELLAALGPGEWIEVDITAAAAPELTLRGVDVIDTSATRLQLRARDAADVLPDLCARLRDQRCAVRSLRVRTPDLGDVFRAATGAPLPTGPGETAQERA